MGGNQSKLHSDTVDEVLLMLPEFGRFWKHPTGVGKCLSTGNVVKYGFKGSPDIVGWIRVPPLAIFTGLEIKTGEGSQSHPQENFEAVLTTDGGLYLLVRHSPNYLDELRRMIQNHRDRLSLLLSSKTL